MAGGVQAVIFVMPLHANGSVTQAGSTRLIHNLQAEITTFSALGTRLADLWSSVACNETTSRFSILALQFSHAATVMEQRVPTVHASSCSFSDEGTQGTVLNIRQWPGHSHADSTCVAFC